MAEALAQGFIAKKKVAAKDIWATDISQARKQVFQDFGANAAESSSDASLSPTLPLLVLLSSLGLIIIAFWGCRSSKTPTLFSSLSSLSMSQW